MESYPDKKILCKRFEGLEEHLLIDRVSLLPIRVVVLARRHSSLERSSPGQFF